MPGLNLANLRAEVLEHLGMDELDLDPDGSNTNLDLLINRSWWEVQDKFDFKEKEQFVSFNTVASTRSYNLATEVSGYDPTILFEALRYISIIDDNNQEHRLDEKSLPWYVDNYTSEASAETFPSNYIRDGGNIYLYPSPDDVYQINLRILNTLADIPVGGPVIPASWHEIIMYGAVWRGHNRNRDYNSGTNAKRIQLGLINTELTTASKEERYSKYAGVQVLGREY